MRKMLMASAAVLISTSALAQNYPNGEPPYRGGPISPDWGGSSPVSDIVLLCTPPLDRKDRNPVTKISVGFEYDWTHRRVVSMDINHQFYYGGFVNRFQQYGNVKLGFDGTIFGWTGVLMRNPAENMAGGVFIGEGERWYYREKHWKNGVADFDITSPCVPMPEGD